MRLQLHCVKIQQQPELLKTILDQKARTSHGGNRFRKDEANSYARETQSRKVSYAKTHSEIYCKCDLYAKKLTRLKTQQPQPAARAVFRLERRKASKRHAQELYSGRHSRQG